MRTDRTFRLASGRESRFYVDVKRTSLDPEGAYWISRLFLKILDDYPEVTAVAGPTLGADPLVSATSAIGWTFGRRLNGLIVRKEAKAHGTAGWLEGPELPSGTRLVLLEDVITSGGSALRSVERLREAGYAVDALLAVVDREEGGRARVSETGLPLHTLFLRRDLDVSS